MAGGRNDEARGHDARRLIGGTLAVLALVGSVIPAGPAGGRVRAGEDEGRGGASGRQRARQEEPEPPHGGVRRYEIGQGPRSYWLFEPDRPRPNTAPVVVFLHGWFAVNPGFYGAWIDHLVRHGHVVIFPRYQNDVGTLPQDFLPNAMAAIHDALGVLAVGMDHGVAHVRPDTRRFALIGHSAGATWPRRSRRCRPTPMPHSPRPEPSSPSCPARSSPCENPPCRAYPRRPS